MHRGLNYGIGFRVSMRSEKCECVFVCVFFNEASFVNNG